VQRFSASIVAAAWTLASVAAGVLAAVLLHYAIGIAILLLLLAVAAGAPAVARANWGDFFRWWRLQTRPVGKGTAVASANAAWPALRRALHPDYVWVTYPGTDEHKRAYFPPWVERVLRPVFPTGVMRFGRYWGMVVSSLATAESLEGSPEQMRGLLEELKGQFPGVPVALAGRLPSIAASTGVGLEPPFTHGDRGTVCAMIGSAREAARVLGHDPGTVTFAVVGSKGFIGSRLVKSLAGEFGGVIALDSRYEERSRGDDGVLYTNRPEDLSEAEALFVLTPKGGDMEVLAPHVSPGAVVADDTHPEMPESLRARLAERGATVLKATLGDERFRFVPPIPGFRADDIPGCILEALVIIQRGERVLETQEAFNRAADELGFRARLAPHRGGRRRGGTSGDVAGARIPSRAAAAG
jgi:hypothetical protein